VRCFDARTHGAQHFNGRVVARHSMMGTRQRRRRVNLLASDERTPVHAQLKLCRVSVFRRVEDVKRYDDARLRCVPRQLDESVGLKNLTVGAGHTNKRRECLCAARFRLGPKPPAAQMALQSYATVTLAGFD
jgi:hypothetical protein